MRGGATSSFDGIFVVVVVDVDADNARVFEKSQPMGAWGTWKGFQGNVDGDVDCDADCDVDGDLDIVDGDVDVDGDVNFGVDVHFLFMLLMLIIFMRFTNLNILIVEVQTYTERSFWLSPRHFWEKVGDDVWLKHHFFPPKTKILSGIRLYYETKTKQKVITDSFVIRCQP